MDPLPYAMVAFLDFLGFQAMIEEDSGPDPPKHLPLILEALGEIETLAAQNNLTILQFSDSIILSSALDPAEFGSLLEAIRDLQRQLVKRSIAIRGGVALGRHYAESGRLFSHALLNAYRLETRRAHVPRILLDKNLIDWVVNHDQYNTALSQALSANLMADRDGEVFVHYLSEDLMESHSQLIKDILLRGETHSSAGILSKAHWMIDYHEYVASKLGCGGLHEGIAARFQTFGGT
jgi:hypothetical protein